MQWFHSHRKLLLGAVGGILLFLVGFWLLGFICWGHASYQEDSPGTMIHSRRGTTLGPRHFYLREGQTLVYTYDVKIREGSLTFFVAKSLPPISEFGKGHMHRVTESGSGRIEVPIHESGRYRISFSPQYGNKHTYDLEYDVTWWSR